MTIPQQIARQLREMHFGNSFTGVNLTSLLEDVNWKQATSKVGSLNTIAMLVFHINYYVNAVLNVLEGGPLNAHDKYSYDMEPISSEADWQGLKTKSFNEAERMAKLIEALPEEKIKEGFASGKYGSYYRNLTGLLEHSHYHLGQISLLKKLTANG